MAFLSDTLARVKPSPTIAVTTKAQGSGLGLALVAKIVGDHGGIVECDPAHRRTTFRILLPMHRGDDGRAAEM